MQTTEHALASASTAASPSAAIADGTGPAQVTLAQTPGNDTPAVERPLWPSVMRGWRCRCPACGAGPIFNGYLKVHDSCPSCGEELIHQRADDGPAYMTLIIVGHIMAPVMLFLFGHWEPDPLIAATALSIAFAGMCLFLLPRTKGAFIGLQWSKRMHGFRNAPTA